MRIAQFINTSNVGGAETMLARLSCQLSAEGHELIIFHFGNAYLEKICHDNNIENKIVPFAKLFHSIFTAQLFSLKFGRLLRENNVDVLHSHLYGALAGSFLGTFIYKISHVATLHDVYMVQERLGRGILLRVAQALNVQLVSVSKDMKCFYENYIPASKEIANIYNGFEWADTPSTEKHNTKRTDDIVRIVIVARLIPLKGHSALINALSKTLITYNANLLIVGDGEEMNNLQNQVKSLNLENYVKFLGERDDVQAILNSSDIFTLPSSTEGLSCSIIEAMNCGLPCVVSSVGGNPELVSHGENGFLFNLEHFQSISKYIEILISDTEKRRNMGDIGKRLALKKFNINNMTQNYIKTYNDVNNK